MLCLFFGAIVATATYPWLGPWAIAAGLGAAAALFLILKILPDRKA